jgi:hypothetical protein
LSATENFRNKKLKFNNPTAIFPYESTIAFK